ncbi:MAG: ATP-binding protein [Actinomycetota bacterium]|nr:ATP-binding protein [Actinomycetota bacterium]
MSASSIALAIVCGVVAAAVIGLWLDRRTTIGRLDEIIRSAGGRPEPMRGVAGRLHELEQVATEGQEHRVALAAVTARFEAALAALPQAVVLCDADGEIVFVNDAGRRYVAARHGEALVEAAVLQLLAAARRGERVERRVDLAGPPRRSFELCAVPVDEPTDDDSRSAALALVEDVTERRRLEDVRRDFVANISHELKTPIGAIGLLADAMGEVDEPEVVQRMALRMQHEADRVGHTIDDLLMLSSIETAELLDQEPLQLAAVFDDAAERVMTSADERSIAVKIERPDDGLGLVGDHRQLVSALTNLLDNAIKYSDEHSVVHLSVTERDDLVEIEVSDTGIGIPAKDVDRVFERFYRVDAARSRATGGTGLGLAIVRHVAVNHGGEVKVRSREGVGSTFVLCLPRVPIPVDDDGALDERDAYQQVNGEWVER